MHFLNAAAGLRSREALSEALGPVAGPVVLSGVTTALGFLAMATNEIALIRDLATYGAFGVAVVTIATVTLAPAILSIWPAPDASRAGIPRFLTASVSPRLVELARSRGRLAVVAWMIVGFAAIVGLSQLRVSSDVIRWFPEDGELRTSYSKIRDRLSGITPVNILISAAEGDRVSTPQMVSVISAFSRDLSEHPLVGRSLSIAEPLREVHEEMAGPDASTIRLSQALIDQYLLLLEGVEQIDDVLTRDRASANILIRLNENSSDSIMAVANWSEDWWDRHGPPGTSISVTGIMYEFGRAQDAISWGGLVGLGLALTAIAAAISLAFRNVFLSVAALIANVLPVACVLGIVGWLGVPLDAATVCVASLSLGIAVDDTVHVVSEFERDWSSGAGDVLESSLGRVLPALVLTTVAILIGFGVLAASEIALVRNLGFMMSASVALCLAADVTLLPAILAMRAQPERA
jgi:predicted RND superfamily exporter protein